MLLKVSMVRIDPIYWHAVNNSGAMARKHPNFRNVVMGAVGHVICTCRNRFQFLHNVETDLPNRNLYIPLH